MQDIALEDVEAGTSGGMGDEYIADKEETSEAGRAESASSSEKEFLYDGGNRCPFYKQFRSWCLLEILFTCLRVRCI